MDWDTRSQTRRIVALPDVIGEDVAESAHNFHLIMLLRVNNIWKKMEV
jgi:hypothetical protein